MIDIKVGFLGLLGLLFIALKLTGYIDWSWWWVTFPIWAGFAIILAIIISLFSIALILAILGLLTRD